MRFSMHMCMRKLFACSFSSPPFPPILPPTRPSFPPNVTLKHVTNVCERMLVNAFPAACRYARSYLLVDMSHDPARSLHCDPVASNPERYLSIMNRISQFRSVRLLTHQGAQHGANLILDIARSEARGLDGLEWLSRQGGGGGQIECVMAGTHAKLGEGVASTPDSTDDCIDYIKGCFLH